MALSETLPNITLDKIRYNHNIGPNYNCLNAWANLPKG